MIAATLRCSAQQTPTERPTRFSIFVLMASNSKSPMDIKPETMTSHPLGLAEMMKRIAKMEYHEIATSTRKTEEAKAEMNAAVARNHASNSPQALKDLEEAVSLITVKNLKLKQEIKSLKENDEKLVEKVNKAQNQKPARSIEELRKHKQYLILNHSKIVQERYEQRRKELRKKKEEEEQEEIAKLEKAIEERRAQIQKARAMADIPGTSKCDSPDDSDQDIPATASRKKKWRTALLDKIQEIEQVKDTHDRTLDQVERLQSRIAEMEIEQPSTSQTVPKVERASPKPGKDTPTSSRSRQSSSQSSSSQASTSQASTSQASSSKGKAASSKVVPKVEKKTPASKSKSKRRSKRVPSEDVIVLSD